MENIKKYFGRLRKVLQFAWEIKVLHDKELQRIHKIGYSVWLKTLLWHAQEQSEKLRAQMKG